VSAIDVKLVDEYRAHKVAEPDHVKDMTNAGRPLRDASARCVRPLSNESINKTLGLLASILDVAVNRLGRPGRRAERRCRAGGHATGRGRRKLAWIEEATELVLVAPRAAGSIASSSSWPTALQRSSSMP